MKTKRTLWIPDLHAPYHDKRAWSLVLNVASLWDWDEVVVLGDFADFYKVSDHPKDPRVRLSFERELDVARACRQQLDDLCKGAKLYAQGNHEERATRYAHSKMPEMAFLIEHQDLVGFRMNGWKYIEYGDFAKLGKVHYSHNAGGAGKQALREAAVNFNASIVSGHTHRAGALYFGDATGRSHVSASFGWLGDRKSLAVRYANQIQKYKDWMLAFGVSVREPNGVTHLQVVPIINYRACVFGEVVQ